MTSFQFDDLSRNAKGWACALLVLAAIFIAPGSVRAEVCHSPFINYLTTPEKYLYVMALDADGNDNDFLAVVDVDITSPKY